MSSKKGRRGYIQYHVKSTRPTHAGGSDYFYYHGKIPIDSDGGLTIDSVKTLIMQDVAFQVRHTLKDCTVEIEVDAANTYARYELLATNGFKTRGVLDAEEAQLTVTALLERAIATELSTTANRLRDHAKLVWSLVYADAYPHVTRAMVTAALVCHQLGLPKDLIRAEICPRIWCNRRQEDWVPNQMPAPELVPAPVKKKRKCRK